MAYQEQLDLLKQGSAVWNAWLDKQLDEGLLIYPYFNEEDLSNANLREVDLSGAHLSGAHLSGANLSGANLIEADLSDADLKGADLSNAVISRADLSGVNLSGADLRKANLRGADLSRADLSRANLREANLYEVNLYEANLKKADLNHADAGRTMFANVDLSVVEGLTTIQHYGPSTIGINTIYRSKGKIPERFLQGAGVPNSFLDYMHSLVGQSIQYFTCFISHSHHDKNFCDRLDADLRSHDVPSWYFPKDATWGKSVWEEIDHGIKDYDKLVVVCSKHSLTSPVVLREIERALQREDRERKHILFPLRLDNYLFEQWENERKADVVSKVAGDFRGWRNADKYNNSLQRFLKALKAQKEPLKS